MKEQFIQKMVAQTMEMAPARARTFLASSICRLRGERPAEDEWGDPLPKLHMDGDAAIVPIRGVISMNVPDWINGWGLGVTDINDIAEEITVAQNDARAAFIVLDFDSPGGWSVASHKFFDLIEKAQSRAGGKPIFAWCGDGAEVCSAAYHGASPARMFLTGPYAGAVGCIGTYQALLDDTEFWKMKGITFEVLRSGEQKGAGIDGFSEAQKAWMKSEVDRYGGAFRTHVSCYRTALDPAEMEGQHYDGAQAARLGFTHGTAVDLSAAIVKFRRML